MAIDIPSPLESVSALNQQVSANRSRYESLRNAVKVPAQAQWEKILENARIGYSKRIQPPPPPPPPATSLPRVGGIDISG